MKRRQFVARGGMAGILAAGSAPAIAQTQPEIRWRMASSFPKSLDTLWGAAEYVAKRVSDLTDGRFRITPYASGEIVPGLQVLDAVQAGTVELGQTGHPPVSAEGGADREHLRVRPIDQSGADVDERAEHLCDVALGLAGLEERLGTGAREERPDDPGEHGGDERLWRGVAAEEVGQARGAPQHAGPLAAHVVEDPAVDLLPDPAVRVGLS